MAQPGNKRKRKLDSERLAERVAKKKRLNKQTNRVEEQENDLSSDDNDSINEQQEYASKQINIALDQPEDEKEEVADLTADDILQEDFLGESGLLQDEDDEEEEEEGDRENSDDGEGVEEGDRERKRRRKRYKKGKEYESEDEDEELEEINRGASRRVVTVDRSQHPEIEEEETIPQHNGEEMDNIIYSESSDDENEDEDDEDDDEGEWKEAGEEQESDEEGEGGYNAEDISSENMSEELIRQMTGDDNVRYLGVEEEPKNLNLMEIQRIREAEDLFSSSIFGLGIKELIKEVSVDYPKAKNTETALFNVKQLIDKIQHIDISEAYNAFHRHCQGIYDFSHSIDSLFPNKTKTKKKKKHIKCKNAIQVSVTGSFMLRTVAKPRLNVDMAVTMPSALLSDADIRDHRYHDKRALFLGSLYQCIDSNRSSIYPNGVSSSVSFELFRSDPRKPIIVIRPLSSRSSVDANTMDRRTRSESDANNDREDLFAIRIIPILHPNALSDETVRQLGPLRNNVSIQNNNKSDNNNNNNRDNNNNNNSQEQLSSDSPPNEDDIVPPTPHYNQSILEDFYITEHLSHIYEELKNSPAALDAVVLLKVWLRQRGLDVRPDAMNGFLATILLLYLVEQGVASKQMSSYQMFRSVLSWLSRSSDLETLAFKPLFKYNNGDNNNNNNSTPIENIDDGDHRGAFAATFPVTLLDRSHQLNLFHRVTQTAWKEMQHEAQQCMQMLEMDQKQEAFTSVFLSPVEFRQTRDVMLRIPVPPQPNEPFVADVPWHQYCQLRTVEILERAFEGRVTNIAVHPETCNNRDAFVLAMDVDPVASTKQVIRGPLGDADESAITDFRDFWGPKAELRTFKDSTTAWSVVFLRPVAHRWRILEDIARHLLHRHLIGDRHLAMQGIFIVGRSLRRLLDPEPDVSYVEAAYRVRNVFEELSMRVTEVRSSQLHLTEAVPLSAHLRYTGFAMPETNTNALLDITQDNVPSSLISTSPFADVLPVLISFGNNQSWPDDPDAIRLLKTQVYYALAEEISDEDLRCSPSEGFLDVAFRGYVFRLVLHVRKELEVLRSKGYALQEPVLRMEREMRHIPPLSYAIRNLHIEFPAFSGTTRLAKRWMHAHMFSNHIRDEAIELICAYLFTHPQPYRVTQSPVTGFLRFLHLISHFKWHETPMIVNISDNLTAEDYRDINNTFEALRSAGQAPAMYIVTSYNKDIDSTWTKRQPTAQMLSRLKIFARQSEALFHRLLDQEVSSGVQQDWKGLFRTNYRDFDVLLQLHHSVSAINRRGFIHEPKKNSIVNIEHFDDDDEDEDETNDNVQQLHQLFVDMKDDESDVDDDEFSGSQQFGTDLIAGFNPVESLVQELRERVEHLGLVFYDQLGSDTIAISWNPSAFLPSSFKLANSTAMLPLSIGEKTSSTVVPNIFELLSDFRNMGRGIVQQINLPAGDNRISDAISNLSLGTTKTKTSTKSKSKNKKSKSTKKKNKQK